MKLSNYSDEKDNNFNLIRLKAALLVLFSHSFALSLGSGDAEPLRSTLDMTLGSIAVDIFFISSGFLVTGSLLKRKSILGFIWARVLRIYPALIVMVLLSVFVLGLFFTSMSAHAFLTSSETRRYLIKNLSLISGVTSLLPGVFETIPYKRAVNGSLWTMPYEIRMYVTLITLWAVLGVTKAFRPKAFHFSVVLLAVISAMICFIDHFQSSSQNHSVRLFYMFFSGAAYYVLKEHITLSLPIFMLFLGTILMSAAIDKHIFFVAYSLLLAYTLFFIAYVPSGRIRSFNNIGDYSYGVYIYAFPIQQSIAALIPGVSVEVMLLTSLLVTLLFSALSWHLIEKHALRLKDCGRPWGKVAPQVGGCEKVG